VKNYKKSRASAAFHRAKNLIILIIITLGILYSFYFVGSLVHSEINNFKSFVGQQVVIKKDTLLVVDYSYWKNTLILSTGTSVNIKFAKNNLVTKQK